MAATARAAEAPSVGHSTDGPTVRLVRGTDAFELLRSAPFQESWQALQKQCPWATVFQGSAFVITWYEAYRDSTEPIVIVGENAAGELVGLLTLALEGEGDGACLVPAGTLHAEYQTWIARPAESDAFMSAACAELHRHFPSGRLQFLFLPAGAPVTFAATAAPWGGAELHTNSRGLLVVGDGREVEASLKKKSNKSRLSRLARHGPIVFEQLHTLEQLDAVFDQIIDFCDLRQGAIHDVLPFRQDPRKRALYRDLMQVPGLLHATVLKVGGELAAAHIGMRDGDRVILGLIVHSPFFAEHSPGKLQVLLLAQMLATQGFAALDLTPGGAYKQRFQTDAESVGVLTLFFRHRDLMRHKAAGRARHLAKRMLVAAHGDPERLRQVASTWRQRLGAQHPADLPRKLLRRGRRLLWDAWESRIYVLPAARAAALPNSGVLAKNDLKALLAFQPAGDSPPTLGSFLREALTRLEQGQHVFTYVKDGLLVHYVWLVERQKRATLAVVDQELDLPPDTAVVFDAFTHPSARGQGIYSAALSQIMHEAAAIPGTRRICANLLSHIGASRHLVDRFGFVYQGSFYKTSRFGRIRRWSEMPTSWPAMILGEEPTTALSDGTC